METTMGRRIIWLDDAKMFAMMCVVFYHCLKYMPADMVGCRATIEVITSFNMHLFVVLAGFTSYRSLQRIASWNDYRGYVVKIALHLLVPTFAIGLLRALLTLDAHAIGNEQWFLKFLFRCLLLFATSRWVIVMSHDYLVAKERIPISRGKVDCATYVTFLLLMFLTSKTKLPEFASYFLFGFLVKKYELVDRLFRMKSDLPLFGSLVLVVLMSGLLLVGITFPSTHSFDFYDYPFGSLFEEGTLSIFFCSALKHHFVQMGKCCCHDRRGKGFAVQLKRCIRIGGIEITGFDQ